MHLGLFTVGGFATFCCNTHDPLTAGNPAIDADAVPTYRVYEDQTTTPILTGSMALLDGANTVGLYSAQITVSAANGFERGKSYHVRIAAVVGGVTGVTLRTLQIEPSVALLDDAVNVDSIEAGTIASEAAVATAVRTELAAELTEIGTLRPRLSTLVTKTATVATDGGNSATTFKTSLTESVTDHYKDCLVKITSGALAEQVKKVTAYNGTTKVLTVSGGFTGTPADAVTLEIVNE